MYWQVKSYAASLCSNLWHSLRLRNFKLKIHYSMKHLTGKQRILLCWRPLHYRRGTNMTSNITLFPRLSLFFPPLSVLHRNVKMTEMPLTWADSSSRRLFSSSASINFCLVISSSLFRASAFSSAWNTEKFTALKRGFLAVLMLWGSHGRRLQ